MQHIDYLRYAFRLENYLLLARAIYAAVLVRRHLSGRSASPSLAAAAAAVDKVYLPAQSTWKISDIGKIALFSGFIINRPVNWGKCVQRSLINYRLLNGYGAPAKICFGVRKDSDDNEGHAWVEMLDRGNQAFAEISNPRDHYKIVYRSELPERTKQ